MRGSKAESLLITYQSLLLSCDGMLPPSSAEQLLVHDSTIEQGRHNHVKMNHMYKYIYICVTVSSYLLILPLIAEP